MQPQRAADLFSEIPPETFLCNASTTWITFTFLQRRISFILSEDPWNYIVTVGFRSSFACSVICLETRFGPSTASLVTGNRVWVDPIIASIGKWRSQLCHHVLLSGFHEKSKYLVRIHVDVMIFGGKCPRDQHFWHTKVKTRCHEIRSRLWRWNAISAMQERLHLKTPT